MNCYTLAAALLAIPVFNHCNAKRPNYHNRGPIVQTSYGHIRGYTFTSPWTGQEITAFTGVPYASPPVGNMRFKDPVPPNTWTDVKDCTEDGVVCMQNINETLIPEYPSLKMGEDCLILNVYTPQLQPHKLLPVLVWIHGGEFIRGSGSRSEYGPDFLVGEGVVVVTINYRLGAFGFLNLGTPDIPGNAALKDQRLALLWVQQEIRKFGGNPGQVTLAGQSAGAKCVILHYLSPLSKGLFHRAIGESSPTLAFEREDGLNYGLQLASVLHCSSDDIYLTQKCLQAAPPEAVLKGQWLVKANEDDLIDITGLAFIPTVDTKSRPVPFLPAMPYEMIKANHGSAVPFIMGINRDEGMLMLRYGEDYVMNITNNLEKFIPKDVRQKNPRSTIRMITERINNFYFKNSRDRSEIIKGYVNLYTDTLFGYDIATIARLLRKRNSVYLYYFAFDGAFKNAHAEPIKEKYNYTGVNHGEELAYLFINRDLNQTAEDHHREMTTWRRLVRMWTNFAKFGTPTIHRDPVLQGTSWSPIGKVSTRYLHIDDNLTMETKDFLGPSVAFWDSVTSSPHLQGVNLATADAIVSVCGTE